MIDFSLETRNMVLDPGRKSVVCVCANKNYSVMMSPSLDSSASDDVLINYYTKLFPFV